ncbi:MAG: O-antigen ligase family protein [Candidatus Manganitrophaceae bacterium]
MWFDRLWPAREAWAPKIMEISLLGYFFLLPWEHTSLWKNLFLGSGMLVWGVERYLLKKDRFSDKRFLNKYVLLYIGAILLSVFFSRDLLISLRALRGDLSKVVLVYVLAVRVYRDSAAVQRLFYGLVASAVPITFYSFSGYLFDWSATVMAGGQVMGPFKYYNAFGHYLAYHFLVALAVFWREEDNRLKFLLGVVLFLQLALILLSQSRTAIAAVVIGTVCFLLMMRRIQTIFAYSLAAVLLFWGLNQQAFFSRLTTILDPETYTSGMGRKEIWKDTILWIQERPWVGHGYGVNLFSKTAQLNARPENWVHAHNLILELLFESGIIGLAAYLLLFSRAAAGSVRFRGNPTLYPILPSLFLLIFALGLTEPLFLSGNSGPFLWIFFALVTTVGSRYYGDGT